MLTLPGWVEATRTQRSKRFAVCYRIERKDGTVFRFTTHDRKLMTRAGPPPLEMAEYQAAGSLSPESARRDAGDSPETSSAFAAFDTDRAGIAQEDVRIGLFDGAEMIVFVVDWRYPFMGPISLSRYFIGEIRWNGERFTFQLASVLQQAEVAVGRVFGRLCDAQLGDDRCRKDITPMKSGTQTVTSVSGFSKANKRLRFRSTNSGAPDRFWTDGICRWLTGNNAIVNLNEQQVKRSIQANGEIELWTQTPYDIEVGDTFECDPGCEKEIVRDCHKKFGNRENHRGFPLMRGTDHILKLPDQKN